MKLAIGGIVHETNTFAPGVTVIEDFKGEWVNGNEQSMGRYLGTRTSPGGAIEGALAEKAELACGIYTTTTPSGMVTKECAEQLMTELVDSLDATADGFIITLHGAMCAEGYPDMEGAIIDRVRAKIGNKPLAITLDLHGNISQHMVDSVDIICGFDTYPHIDAYERAFEAAQLISRTIRGEVKPTRAIVYPNMLIVPQVMLTDVEGPMKELMDRAFAIEEDPKVLNVTVIGGFPYADTPDTGVAFIVTTDNDQALAEQYAEELSAMAWERRERLQYHALVPEEAIALAMKEEEGPVVLVEGSDNVGGGAPADATHILKHLVNPAKKSLIVICDKEGALLAHKLGVGAQFSAAIGGKSSELHGQPVEVTGQIRLLSDGDYVHVGAYMTGKQARMGKTAIIEAGLLTIILTEKRVPPWDPGHFMSVGLRAEDFHVIVVKAAIAWKTSFGAVCKKIIPVDTPGCCGSNLFHFTYDLLKRPIDPLDQITK